PINERYKWLGNFKANDIGGVKTLPPKGDKLIITKGYKDYRVLKNYNFNSIWYQSEKIFPSIDVITSIINRFDEVIILFDNDKVGMQYSLKVLDILKVVHPNVRCTFINPKLNIKDISDLKHKGNKNDFNNFINKEL